MQISEIYDRCTPGGPNGDCMEWAGQLSGPADYKRPVTVLDGRVRSIARRIFSQSNPTVDMTGRVIHMACGNGRCLNCSHMVAMSRKELTQHRRYTRTVRGTASHMAKLDEEKVKEIRVLSGLGVRQTVLAEKYGVSQCCINGVVTGKTWKHVL